MAWVITVDGPCMGLVIQRQSQNRLLIELAIMSATITLSLETCREAVAALVVEALLLSVKK